MKKYNVTVNGTAYEVILEAAGPEATPAPVYTAPTPAPVAPDAPSEPEVSEPEEPSEEPSEDDSSELPPTSDAGVLVFAILGVLAIVGAAVVIKVRN